METATLPRPVERAPELPELSFMDAAAVADMREQQHKLVLDAGRDAVMGTNLRDNPGVNLYEIRRDAEERTRGGLDDMCEARVAEHVDKTENPELFDRLSTLLKSASIHRMSDEQWSLGTPDANGKHTNPQTSGRFQLQKAVAEIRSTTLEPSEIVDTPELRALRNDVEVARRKVAALSVELRSKIRKGGRKNKALRERYDVADKEYHELFTRLNLEEVRLLKSSGRTDQQVLQYGVTNLLNEHQAFSLVEKDIITHDDSRRGKIANWFAAKKWRLPVISGAVGIGVGYGFGVAKNVITPFVALPSAVLLPAVAGATVAVKSTRAILAATIGNRVDQLVHFDKRYNEDKAKLESATQNFTIGATDEATAKQHSNALRKLLSDRIENDRKSNGRRVAIAAGAGALGGAIGYGIHEAIDTQGFGIWASHNQTPAGPTPPIVEENPNPPGAGAGNNGPRIEKVAVVDPNVVDGYDTNVMVENGHGYQREIIELLQEKNQHLSSENSWKLYLHLQNKFPSGNFFTDNASYKMNDGYFGISRDGGSHWNPAVIHEINRWMAEHANEVTTS